MAANSLRQKDARTQVAAKPIVKAATGNAGLDEILRGGFPVGRTTLLSGGPGSGKSLLALEFMLGGAEAGEPGIFVPFEERADAVRTNALTLGWDLAALERQGRIFVLDTHIDHETIVSGSFDLKGLLSIVEGVIRDMGTKRLALDAIDVLLRFFNDTTREREQLFALNDWLLEHAVTTVLTVKRSVNDDGNSRYEFLDYLADCVLHLDQRVVEQVTTRRLRVLKYRGSDYGRNEYPFVTAAGGLRIIPVSGVELRHQPLGEPVSSGRRELDEALGGGYLRASSVLVAGASGTGKTTLASTFACAAAARGEKVMMISFEESIEAVASAMLSSGTDLRPGLQSGLIRPVTAMPEAMGVEEHLLRILDCIEAFEPDHVIVDAISATRRMGSGHSAFEFLVRLLSPCRERGITTILLNQTSDDGTIFQIAGHELSSLVDSIIFLRYVESGGETNRVLSIIKSRGRNHSNQLREFRISNSGVELASIYSGKGEVLTGAARQEKEANDAVELRRIEAHIQAKQREIDRHRAEMQAEEARRLAALDQAELELRQMEMERDKAREAQDARLQMRSGTMPEPTLLSSED